MKILLSVFIISLLASCKSWKDMTLSSTDEYSDFADLSKHNTLNQDYTIHIRNNNAETTVFAIHGGLIDLHTSEIATAVAGDDFNLYTFNGLSTKKNLHITSHHFDEPQAIALTQLSEKCLSIHGFRKSKTNKICIGGNDPQFRLEVLENLRRTNFPIEYELFCEGLEGVEPLNIVNRCPYGGVQLELSKKLRDELISDKKFLKEFSSVIHQILSQPRRYIRIYNPTPQS